MGNVVIVGDTGGYVRAYEKATGKPVTWGGYPLRLSTDPYQSGDQGEHWWEPISGTATQMAVARKMMLVGVNSQTDERTVLKAFRLHPLPDLVMEHLSVPATAETTGFTTRVDVRCDFCAEAVTASVSLRINGRELRRQAITFDRHGAAHRLTWESGPVPADRQVEVVATIDPANQIDERDETNNSLRAAVDTSIGTSGPSEDDGFGSKLSD